MIQHICPFCYSECKQRDYDTTTRMQFECGNCQVSEVTFGEDWVPPYTKFAVSYFDQKLSFIAVTIEPYTIRFDYEMNETLFYSVEKRKEIMTLPYVVELDMDNVEESTSYIISRLAKLAIFI